MKTETPFEEFNRIIDKIEIRCMASEGPVTPTLKEATEDELSRLWHLLQAIKKDYSKLLSALVTRDGELVSKTLKKEIEKLREELKESKMNLQSSNPINTEHECEFFGMTDIAVHGCECGNIIVSGLGASEEYTPIKHERDNPIAFARWILKEGIEKAFDGSFLTWRYSSSLFDEYPEGFYDTAELYEIYKKQIGIK